MLKSILSVLLSVAVVAASAEPTESSYNKGVAAWRVKDYAEARKQWAASLAEGGPDEAFNNLGYLLFYGLGGDADQEKAVELWRKDAILSVSEAQVHLGRAYATGKGVARDAPLAYAWYQCAIATSSRLSAADSTEAEIQASAEAARDELLGSLSEAERAEGDRIAKELVSKYAVRLSTAKP